MLLFFIQKTLNTFKKAFSFIELLISLIIISLVAAAFVPVLTKKIKHREIAYSASKNVSIDCAKFDLENRCMMCTKDSCTLCITQMSIPEGYYVNPENGCDYKKCVEKFEGCKTCNKDFCVNCLEGFGYDSNTKKCFKCSDNCLDCAATACIKCQKGYMLSKGQCKKITDAPCLMAGNICIAKFNAGDNGGLAIPSGVEVRGTVANNASVGGCHSKAICWQGTTTSNCDAANGGYSGCYRTVCTWSAADKICSSHGWRLPSEAEAASFNYYSQGRGSSGLQLCDGTAGYSNAACGPWHSCPGSLRGKCHLYFVWIDTAGKRYALNQGVWVLGGDCQSDPYSVRCVRDL